MSFRICLIGSIPKGDDERKKWIDWKQEYKEKLSVIKNVEFVDRDAWKDESKPLLTFGHDANLIKNSDLIIADARQKLGAGTSQELLIAKYFSKPVITVLPKDTYHRKSNIVFNDKLIEDWIHPFILATSDLIIEKIEDSIEWIREYMKNQKSKKIKNIKIIDEAIEAYLS
jgi:hypothetical protein